MIFSSLVGLFFVLLGVKHFIRKEFCVLCASVSLTWIIFFVAYKLGAWVDPLPIILLMGGSVVGLYYLVDRRVPALLHVFRLPFFLTLVLGVLMLFYPIRDLLFPWVLTLGVWLLMALAYAFRQVPGVRTFFKQLLACCRNW